MLVNTDAATFLEEYRYEGNELIYADPPYVRSLRLKARIYRYDYDLGQHIRLLHVLKSAKCRVMISGYQGELYERELRQWRHISFSVQSHAGSRTERVWMNFDPPAELHDGSFMGSTFRERQTMRRRQLRLLRRFEQMESTERQHLLSLLSKRYETGVVR
jgi:hypothetical protein